MTAGCSDTAESASRCTSLTWTDCSREKGLVGSSADDKESRCERLSAMVWVDKGCGCGCVRLWKRAVPLSASVVGGEELDGGDDDV